MPRIPILIIIAVVFLGAMVVNTDLALRANRNANGAIHRNHALIVEFRKAEIALAASEKHQARQRVTTVKARCDLTRLDIEGRHGRSLAAFRASLAGCLKQLKTVEHLAVGA